METTAQVEPVTQDGAPDKTAAERLADFKAQAKEPKSKKTQAKAKAESKPEAPTPPEAPKAEVVEEAKPAEAKTEDPPPPARKRKLTGYNVRLLEGQVYGVGTRTFRARTVTFVPVSERWLLNQLLHNGRFHCAPLEV